MASRISFYKVLTLPQVLKPDSLYFVKNGSFAETYLTDSTGAKIDVGNSEMIIDLINQHVNIIAGNYEHNQAVASSVWVVNHNLGFKPGGITVKDSTGRLVIGGEVDYITNNQLTITYDGSFAGTAKIS